MYTRAGIYMYDGRGKTGLLRVRSHSNMLYSVQYTQKRQNDERERIMHDGRIINIIAICITIFSFQHIYSVCDPK